jgi:uncharacterized Tic20 family protein
MTLANKKITTLLYSVEGVGIVFVAIFLAAYLGGLPTTAVLHSEPAFKIPLIIFGAALVILILVTTILAAATKGHSNS